MVGQGAETPLRQLQSRFFGELPGEPVDDGRTALVLLQKVQERTEGLGLGLDGIGQVGAVETGDEYLRLSETELIDDVFPDRLGGGGCQGDDRHAGEVFPKPFQIAVVGPKVVTPLGDAVGLVDGDQADVQRLQEPLESGEGQSLRGHIENLDLVLPGLVLDQGRFFLSQCAVQQPGGDSVGPETIHLVFHQGDKRRDHQREAL